MQSWKIWRTVLELGAVLLRIKEIELSQSIYAQRIRIPHDTLQEYVRQRLTILQRE
jgi:hypothetical protein